MGKSIASTGLVLTFLMSVSATGFRLRFSLPPVNIGPSVSAVDLGSAENYVILAKSGISTTDSSDIVGNLGLSPAKASFITGFDLNLSPDGTTSSSSLVNGTVQGADYASPTPSTLTTAISDMEAAYTDAAGRSNPTTLNFKEGNLTGATIPPGLHKWDSAVTMGGTVTFSGVPMSIYIFQISGALLLDSGAKMELQGGVRPENIFYQVAETVTIGSSAAAQGIILGKTGIVFAPGASLNTGRALAQTHVTLIGNTVKSP